MAPSTLQHHGKFILHAAAAQPHADVTALKAPQSSLDFLNFHQQPREWEDSNLLPPCALSQLSNTCNYGAPSHELHSQKSASHAMPPACLCIHTPCRHHQQANQAPLDRMRCLHAAAHQQRKAVHPHRASPPAAALHAAATAAGSSIEHSQWQPHPQATRTSQEMPAEGQHA